jgi:hypothetical protein
MTKTWWKAPMGGSVLSFLKAEWKVSDTGSAHWASSLIVREWNWHVTVQLNVTTLRTLFQCMDLSHANSHKYLNSDFTVFICLKLILSNINVFYLSFNWFFWGINYGLLPLDCDYTWEYHTTLWMLT